MLQLLIVDNEAIIRNGIKLILEESNEIIVVGTAENGKEAFEFCKNNYVDLVLMDLSMPICDGIESTKLIKEFNPNIKVLMLTTFFEDEGIINALNNGADGYLLKDIEPQELISTIKSTVKGLRTIHKNVYETVLKNFSKPAADLKNADVTTKVIENFTENEINVIKLLVQGKSNKDIASCLFLSEGRIRNIISEILLKTGLNGRTQLAVYAVKNNIIDGDFML